jgi:hypothetical protein
MTKLIVRGKKTRVHEDIGEGVVLEADQSGTFTIKGTPCLKEAVKRLKKNKLLMGSPTMQLLEFLAKERKATLLIKSVDIHTDCSAQMQIPNVDGTYVSVQTKQSDRFELSIELRREDP